MYISIFKIIRLPGIILGILPIGFGVYKFIVAPNINQQIAATLVAIFGLQLVWFILWSTKGK